MAHFILVGEGGAILGLYCDAPGYTEPPIGAVAVSAEHADLLRAGFHRYLWVDGQLVPNLQRELAELKLKKNAEINAACSKLIVGGFVSSALGTDHHYDSAETDQLNLIGAAALGTDVDYTCTDPAGAKTARLHTAAQIQQVLVDGAVFKMAALNKARGLKVALQNALTGADAELVVWQ